MRRREEIQKTRKEKTQKEDNKEKDTENKHTEKTWWAVWGVRRKREEKVVVEMEEEGVVRCRVRRGREMTACSEVLPQLLARDIHSDECYLYRRHSH